MHAYLHSRYLFRRAFGGFYLKLWLICFIGLLQAAAMITLDTQANAKLATSNANESTMIAKLQENLRLFQQLLDRAKSQANTLEQIKDTLAQTQEFMRASIAPLEPMQIYLEQELKTAQIQEKDLQKRMQDYLKFQTIQLARLEKACPWLDFNTATLTQDHPQAKQILETLKHHNPPLAPKPLSMLLCERVQASEAKEKYQENLKDMQEALLKGDFKHYKQIQAKVFYPDSKQMPLIPLDKRLEQLQENFSNTHLEEQIKALNSHLATDLKQAKNPNARALAYANYNQQAQGLQLRLLLELTRHLAFLNETMAMQASLLNKHLPLKSSTPLNAYGFPN